MSEYLSPIVEPETRAFLDGLASRGGKPLYEMAPADAREVLSGLQAGEIEKFPADIEERTLPGGPGDKGVSIRIVRPSGRTGALPVIMYFHGGGWVLGDAGTHVRLVRELAHGTGAAVVFVNFTLSPEARFPVQIEEAYAATSWIAKNGKSINLDPSSMVVAGDSVGGNMATVVAMMAAERGGPSIEFQLLFYPVTDASFDTGSYHDYQTGYFLERESMKWFWGSYLADATEGSNPLASPLRASLEQLESMPPALIIFGENDVLRDHVEAYARKLADAGVKVTATRYLGTIHDFVMLNPITTTPASRGALSQAIAALREVFGEAESAEERPAGRHPTAAAYEVPGPMPH